MNACNFLLSARCLYLFVPNVLWIRAHVHRESSCKPHFKSGDYGRRGRGVDLISDIDVCEGCVELVRPLDRGSEDR